MLSIVIFQWLDIYSFKSCVENFVSAVNQIINVNQDITIVLLLKEF